MLWGYILEYLSNVKKIDINEYCLKKCISSINTAHSLSGSMQEPNEGKMHPYVLIDLSTATKKDGKIV